MDLEPHRALLWGLAYRMTGDAAEADDIVQDAMVRTIEHPPPDTGRPLRPWLVTVTMNLARDRLRARRRRHHLGPWLPSPVPDDQLGAGLAPDDRIALRESAGMAFLVAAEALTPTQRAAYLCREVLEMSSAETAEALGVTPGGVDVAVHKARARLKSVDRSDTGPVADAVVLAFLGALQLGLTGAAARLLRPDVVCLNDGGGRYHAAKVPVVGARKVVNFLRRTARLEPEPLRWSHRRCNGLLTLVAERAHPEAHQSRHMSFSLEVREGRIAALYCQMLPERLVRVVSAGTRTPRGAGGGRGGAARDPAPTGG